MKEDTDLKHSLHKFFFLMIIIMYFQDFSMGLTISRPNGLVYLHEKKALQFGLPKPRREESCM